VLCAVLLVVWCELSYGTPPSVRPVLDALHRRLRLFTLGTVRKRLLQYIKLADKADDVAASCMFHACHVLLFAQHRDNEFTADSIVSFVSSCGFVMSWHSREPECAAQEPKEIRSYYYSYSRGNSKDSPQATDGKTPKVPMGLVFDALQRQRGRVMRWLQFAEAGDVDNLLSRLTAVSLRKAHMTAQRGWQIANEKPLMCQLVLQSNHPYRAGSDVYLPVCFHGAARMELFFDERCEMEVNHDYVTLYKDSTCTTFWGPRERLSGSVNQGLWPGAGGREPLNIPTDSFVLHFHSDLESEAFGYRLRIVAPVNEATAERMHATFPRPLPSGGSEQWPLWHCRKALAECLNEEARAQDYLLQHGLTLDAELEALERAKAEAAKRTDQGRSVNGLFRDPTGVVEVNVQATEVRRVWCGVVMNAAFRVLLAPVLHVAHVGCCCLTHGMVALPPVGVCSRPHDCARSG